MTIEQLGPIVAAFVAGCVVGFIVRGWKSLGPFWDAVLADDLDDLDDLDDDLDAEDTKQ